MAADNILSSLEQPNMSLEEAIDSWNKKNAELNKEKKMNKVDYKTRLDEMFKGAGKCYHREDLKRPLSRERSSEHRESRYSSDRYYPPRKDNLVYRHESSHYKKDNYMKYYPSDRYWLGNNPDNDYDFQLDQNMISSSTSSSRF